MNSWDTEGKRYLHWILRVSLDKKQHTEAMESKTKETGSQRALMEYRLNFNSGKQVTVETKISLVYKDRKPNAITGIARDITARKELRLC